MRFAMLALAVLFGVLLGSSLEKDPRGNRRNLEALEAHRETAERIVAEALANGRAYALLENLCETAPHRLSGSEGAERAIRWAEDTMNELGFDNVRREPCEVPVWVRGSVERLEFQEEFDGPLPILALGGSDPTPKGGITAEVIVVDGFEDLEQRASEAYGRIVLFNRPMDASLYETSSAYGGAVGQRVGGASAAARHGAVAAIVRSMTTRLDDVPHTGTMRYADDAPRIPTAAVSTLGAERIARAVEERPDIRLTLELDCENRAPVGSYNVVGELEGTELPDEIVVVGGHLDCWDVGQGAHDDGSGAVQSIEAARLLAALDLRPKRTVRVVLFMNEENGLAGATAYHLDHSDEMPNHVLALESDSGGFAPRGFRTDAEGPERLWIDAVAAQLGAFGVDRVTRGGGGADVGPMSASGVVTVGLRTDPARYFDLHHTRRDTIEAVSPRELELGAASMAWLVWAAAELNFGAE